MGAVKQDLNIDGQRLWDSLMALATIGATPAGGVNRQALTAVDLRARKQFVLWCEEVGCHVRMDAIGNLFARLPGLHDELPAVMMGSHLDSQPTGGKFDGAYGVMAGLEVLRTIHDSGQVLQRSIELVAWSNEEGARFAPSMMGSSVYAGLLPLTDALAVTDVDNVTVAEALQHIDVTGLTGSLQGLPMVYLEAHIEQGPILEANHKTIGVVTAAQGQCWFRLMFKGRDAHAGSTPMHMRADALAAAALVITALNNLGRENTPGCATAGSLVVLPNSPNVIPGAVVLTVEIRHPDDTVRSAMEAVFHEAVRAAGQTHHVEINIEKVLEQPSAPFAGVCRHVIQRSAQQRGFSYMDIVSGAAHDAVALSRIVPAGMIFVPCAGGISHNESESAEPDDLSAGCQVLCDSVLSFCEGVTEY